MYTHINFSIKGLSSSTRRARPSKVHFPYKHKTIPLKAGASSPTSLVSTMDLSKAATTPTFLSIFSPRRPLRSMFLGSSMGFAASALFSPPYLIKSPPTFSDDDISGDNPFNSVVERINVDYHKGGAETVCDVLGYSDHAAYVKMEMPGKKKEGVKAWVDKWALHMKGEGGHNHKGYHSVLEIPEGFYQKEKIRAFWRREELLVEIPRVMPEDGEGVLDVEVESVE